MVVVEEQQSSAASSAGSPSTMPGSYHQLSRNETGDEDAISTSAGDIAARRTLWNFSLMSVLFSANHGCVAGEHLLHELVWSLV